MSIGNTISLTSPDTDTIRADVLGNYGRGIPQATSAPNGNYVNASLSSVIEGGDISYNATVKGFDIPDGAVVEITATLKDLGGSASPYVRFATGSANSTSIISGLDETDLSASNTKIFQGVYENNTGGVLTISAGVFGSGNTGNLLAGGYLMVRKIN